MAVPGFDAFRTPLDFKSRATRPEYWWFVLVMLAAQQVAIFGTFFGGVPYLLTLWILLFIIPYAAVLVRRLHDTDRSGWWALLHLALLLLGSIAFDSLFSSFAAELATRLLTKHCSWPCSPATWCILSTRSSSSCSRLRTVPPVRTDTVPILKTNRPPVDNVRLIVQLSTMNVVNYSDARANLKAVMDGVTVDHVPTIITRQRGEPVVMISLSYWNSMAETDYLLSSPNNARALREAIARMDAGEGEEHELIRP